MQCLTCGAELTPEQLAEGICPHCGAPLDASNPSAMVSEAPPAAVQAGPLETPEAFPPPTEPYTGASPYGEVTAPITQPPPPPLPRRQLPADRALLGLAIGGAALIAFLLCLCVLLAQARHVIAFGAPSSAITVVTATPKTPKAPSVPTAPPANSMTSFTSDTGNYSLSYPGGWTHSTPQLVPGDASDTFTAPDARERFTITAIDVPLAPAQYGMVDRIYLAHTFGHYDITSRPTIAVVTQDNMTWEQLTSNFQIDDGTAWTTVELITRRDFGTIVVFYTAPASDFATDEQQDFTPMFQSINL